MKKKLDELLTDGVTPTEELITDEMTCASLEGIDLDRVTSLTLEKTGVKAARTGFFRRYYKQFSALAACLVLAVGVFAAYRIWGTDAPTPNSDSDGDGTDVKDYINMDGIVWADDAPTGEDREDVNAEGEPSGTEGADVYPNVPEGEPGGIGCEMPEVDTDENHYEEPNETVGVPEYNDDEVCSVEWNGLEVEWPLYLRLTQGDAGVTFAVRIDNTSRDVPSDYVYNGRSLAEWHELVHELTIKEEKIFSVYKLGFDLVYGKDLYTGGAPTGVTWTKDLYHETMEEYGEMFDLLYAEYESYLTEHGLWEDVADDIGLYWEKMEAVAHDMYIENALEMDRIYTVINEACETYIIENSVLLGIGSEFYDAAKSLGIDVYANGNHAYIFVTAEQFTALAGKINGDGLLFSLATKQQFASEFGENGDPVDDTRDPYDTVGDMETTPVYVEDDTTCDVGIGYDDWETETAPLDSTDDWETAIQEPHEVSPPYDPNE